MIYRQLQFLCGTLLVLVLQITTDCRAAVNVFGDSLSERGNFFLASGGAFPPTPPYHEGRFSNGPAWIEYFACALGEEVPLPIVLGGTNFVFNGARGWPLTLFNARFGYAGRQLSGHQGWDGGSQRRVCHLGGCQ